MPLKSSRRSFPFLVYTSPYPSAVHGIYVRRSSFCRWRFGADAAGECLLLMTCSLMTRNLIICSLLLFALPANHVGECWSLSQQVYILHFLLFHISYQHFEQRSQNANDAMRMHFAMRRNVSALTALMRVRFNDYAPEAVFSAEDCTSKMWLNNTFQRI